MTKVNRGEEVKQYKVFDGECPNCGIRLIMDYEIKPGVQFYRFECVKCKKEIQIDKATGKVRNKK